MKNCNILSSLFFIMPFFSCHLIAVTWPKDLTLSRRGIDKQKQSEKERREKRNRLKEKKS